MATRHRPVHRPGQRRYRPHVLTEPEEKIAEDLANTGARAWNRLFDETMGALTFDVSGEVLNLEATLTLLTDADRARRAAAAKAPAEMDFIDFALLNFEP